jgi:ribosomal protein L29
MALDSIRGELSAQLGAHRAEVNGELALLRQEVISSGAERTRENERVQNELARIGRTLGQLVTGDLEDQITTKVRAGLRLTIWRATGGLLTAIGVAAGVIALFL